MMISRRAVIAGALAGVGCAAAVRSPVYVEDHGGRGGTRGDARRNAQAIRAAFASGATTLRLRPGELYNIAPFAIPSGCRLVGAGSRPPTLRLDPAIFTNRNPRAKTGGDVLAIDLSGETTGAKRPARGVAIEGVRMLWDGPDGRALRFVRASNVADLSLRGMVFEGLGVGRAVVLNSLSGDWSVEDCRFQNFHSDIDLGPGCQTTAIEIDDDRSNGGTVGGRIVNCVARDIEYGETLRTARNDQTDFINIGVECRGLSIVEPQGRNVGEMIDSFADDLTVISPRFEQARAHGLKFVHGAQRNRIVGGYVRGFGRSGIVFAGSNTRAQDTAFNTVENFEVSGGNYRGQWGGSAALLFEAHADSPGKYRSNVVRGGRLDAGQAEVTIRDDGLGTGNLVIDVTATPGREGLMRPLNSASVEVRGLRTA